jgi:hypothetical protein
LVALASLSCQDAHFSEIVQTARLDGGSGGFVQEGVVTVRDSEEATVVYPKAFAATPNLTFKIDQVWIKEIPYSRADFRISQNQAYFFKIENNHREKLQGAWAVLKWKAEGIRLTDKPAASRTKREQVLAMVERLGGKVTEEVRLPGRPIARIDLHQSRVTDDDLQLLEGLSSLHTLNLFGTGISDVGLAHLSALPGLQTLQLNSTAIGDAGLVHLQSLKNLNELGLYHTRVTDDGLRFLGSMTALQKLVLGGPAISDKGLNNLQRLRNLKRLVLVQTSVTTAGTQALQKALPHLEIVR